MKSIEQKRKEALQRRLVDLQNYKDLLSTKKFSLEYIPAAYLAKKIVICQNDILNLNNKLGVREAS